VSREYFGRIASALFYGSPSSLFGQEQKMIQAKKEGSRAGKFLEFLGPGVGFLSRINCYRKFQWLTEFFFSRNRAREASYGMRP
jgi:hypothetical protein